MKFSDGHESAPLVMSGTLFIFINFKVKDEGLFEEDTLDMYCMAI